MQKVKQQTELFQRAKKFCFGEKESEALLLVLFANKNKENSRIRDENLAK